MKIIAFTSSTGASGGVRQAVYQTEGLRALGHDAVLCLPHNSAMWVGQKPAEGWLRLPEQESAWKPFLESLFGSGPTVVHAFHNRSVKLAAWWGLEWRRRGVVCVAHRGIIIRPKNPLPYWSPAIRRFIVNSGACARSLSWYCPQRKILVVPNAIPDARVVPAVSMEQARAWLNVTEQNFVFGYIGNDNPAKGTDTLLHALSAACRRDGMGDVRLVMVGVTPSIWLPQAEALGVADRVRVIHRHEHVSDILQVCDAFVFPSRGMDSAPNVLLEAVRMGLPVISSDVGGCPDIMDNNGIMVKGGRVAPLAQAMVAMRQDATARAAWAAQSLAVGARYSTEARCLKLEAIYLSLF